MATSLTKINECLCSSKDQIQDLTFDNYVSPRETKYIVKAVGEILLEIQKYSEKQSRVRRTTSQLKETKSPLKTNFEEGLLYKPKQGLSDEKTNQPISEISNSSEQTYHR